MEMISTVKLLESHISIKDADVPIAHLITRFMSDNINIPWAEAEKMCYRFAASLSQFNGLSLPDGTTYRRK